MPKGFCQPPVSSTKEQTPNHCQLEPAFTRHLGKIFPLVLFFTSTWFVLQEDVRVRWPLRLGEGPLLRWRVRERRHLWLRRIYTVHCASNRRHLPLHRWVVPVMRRSNHQDSSSQLEFSEALVWKGPFEPWKKIIFNTKQLWKHSNETFVGQYLNKLPYLESFIKSPSCSWIRADIASYYLVRRFQNVMEWHLCC